MKRPFMVDLYSGLGGASRAMRMRGWTVLAVEVDRKFRPTAYGDCRYLPIRPDCRPDLLWASPPCVEFSRETMPWTRTGKEPSLDLVRAVYSAVDLLNPRFWIMENVRGAQPWIGRAEQHMGPIYLWGRFPPVDIEVKNFRKKFSGDRPDLRSEIPFKVSWAVALSVERERRRARSVVV